MAARTRALTAAALALAGGALVAGQEPVFRASVETVRLDVSVTRGAQPVAGLTADQFEVRDNGVVQTVDRVSLAEVPLQLLLVLDTSSSLTGERLQALLDAARGLVGALRPRDRVGLVTFSQSARIAVPLTTGHGEVTEALARVTPAGATAWRDALFVGLHLFDTTIDARPVVLLFTDGEDTASWTEASAIAETVRRSGAVLHAVGFTTTGRAFTRDNHNRRIGELAPSRSLQAAVDAGGGRLWSAQTPAALRALFVSALDELRARYLIAYSPPGPPVPGWHDVRVRLKGARGEVTARPGYFVSAP
ncbi:MAG: VWA domain-containing protein [Vicinamibacterales bacterium]